MYLNNNSENFGEFYGINNCVLAMSVCGGSCKILDIPQPEGACKILDIPQSGGACKILDISYQAGACKK
jgi:hypothetical protein